MLKIGLTGGIGSGKSTVARLFAELNIGVIDTDSIAREVIVPGSPAFDKIVANFGDDVLDATGAIDRKHLRALIFQNPDNKKWLENLLHPMIIAAMQERIKQVKSPYCVLVIPLLLEIKLQNEVDHILVVDAKEEQQIERTMQRDGITKAEIKAILKTQIGREQRLTEADDVIYNSGSLAELKQQVKKLHKKYLLWNRT